MRHLLRAAFQTRQLRWLIAVMCLSMVLLTVASQMEILAFGILTKKGPTFFELFAPQDAQVITRSDVDVRWEEIDVDGKGALSRGAVDTYMARSGRGDSVQRLLGRVNERLIADGGIPTLALLIVIVALFKAATLFTYRYTARLVAIIVSSNQRQRYFEHIQALPMSFYQKHEIGSLSSRVVGDAFLIAEAIDSWMVNYLQTPFTLVTTLILCIFTSWQLSLLIFIGMPLILIPIVLLAKRVKKVSRQILKKQEHFASTLIDFIAGIQTVKVFAMEAFSFKKYGEQNQALAHLERKSARYDLLTRPIVHTVAMLLLATTMLYGLYILQMGVPEVLVFCGFLYVFYEPIKKFAEENHHIQRGIAAAERMQEVMNEQPQIEDAPNALELRSFESALEFHDVWFRYNDAWVLKGLSFKVNKGETVAIVGPTGAGKSTIVQLIPRLYDIQQGAITIDGMPLSAYTQRSIREQIAVVPQKPFLFIDTVAANISFGRSFSMEAIILAAQRAHADDFISRLPQGYNTPLAEAGKDLSGGQQQRLAIARALVKGAPLLIMDEATSSLDMVSEQRIKAALHNLDSEITQIIVAHRLSTIEDADTIVYLEDGVVIAQGTKDELLVSCSGFRTMWLAMHHQDAKGVESAVLA